MMYGYMLCQTVGMVLTLLTCTFCGIQNVHTDEAAGRESGLSGASTAAPVPFAVN